MLFLQVMESSHVSLPLMTSEVVHRFSSTWCSQTIELSNNNSSAVRNRHVPHGLVMASTPLWQTNEDEIFEIRIDEVHRHWSGSLKFGVATMIPHQTNVKDLGSLKGEVYYLEGHSVYHNDGQILKMNYAVTSLERLIVGDKLAVKRLNADNSLRFYINDEDCGVAVSNVPKKLIPVVELSGSTASVSVISVSQTGYPSPTGSLMMHHKLPSMNTMMDSLEVVLEDEKSDDPAGNGGRQDQGLEFHEHHGRNIQLRNNNKSAIRTDSYNQGMTLTHRPLKVNEKLEVKIDRLNNRWTSSLMIGVLFEAPERIHLPVTALGLKKNAIVFHGETLFQNGQKIDTIGANLDHLEVGQRLGILIDAQRNLRLFVNSLDLGIMVKNIPQVCYGILDLYGQCEEVSFDLSNTSESTAAPENLASITEDHPAKLVVSHPLVLRPEVPPGGGTSNSSSNCDYLRLCSEFKSSLSVPSHFWSGSTGTCFCLVCMKGRGEDSYKKKGDPPRDYATPSHWVRFPLRQMKAEQTTETWHTCYHGTKASSVRKILDHGELFPILEFGLTHKAASKPKESKEDDADTPQLVFSPTPAYFLRSPQRSTIQLPAEDEISQQAFFKAKVAFEIDIHPGSYKIGPPSLLGFEATADEAIDSHFKTDESEWSTKEKGNTAIKALLIHLLPSSFS